MYMNSLILLQAQSGGWSSIIMIIALFVIFYFFMIRPQQKRQKQIRDFRQGLQKGDAVVTAGGIHGTIADLCEQKTYFLVDIAKGLTIRVDKGSVYPSAGDAAQDPNQQNSIKQ